MGAFAGLSSDASQQVFDCLNALAKAMSDIMQPSEMLRLRMLLLRQQSMVGCLPKTYGDRERRQLLTSPMGQFLFDGEMLAEVEQREQDSSQRALVSQIARGLAFSGHGTRVSTRSASGSSHHSREAPQTFPSSVPPLPAPRPSCPKGSPRQMTSGWAPEGPASALEVVVGLYPSAVTQVVGTSLPSFFESEGISSQAPPRHGILGGAWFLPPRHRQSG